MAACWTGDGRVYPAFDNACRILGGRRRSWNEDASPMTSLVRDDVMSSIEIIGLAKSFFIMMGTL